MPLVFSYGTLQDERVQLATFGRPLRGSKDALPAYERVQVPIADRTAAAAKGRTYYDNVSFNGDPRRQVAGMVFEFTDDELAAADRYEHEAGFKRVSVVLASGTRAWLYVDARTAGR